MARYVVVYTDQMDWHGKRYVGVVDVKLSGGMRQQRAQMQQAMTAAYPNHSELYVEDYSTVDNVMRNRLCFYEDREQDARRAADEAGG